MIRASSSVILLPPRMRFPSAFAVLSALHASIFSSFSVSDFPRFHGVRDLLLVNCFLAFAVPLYFLGPIRRFLLVFLGGSFPFCCDIATRDLGQVRPPKESWFLCDRLLSLVPLPSRAPAASILL